MKFKACAFSVLTLASVCAHAAGPNKPIFSDTFDGSTLGRAWTISTWTNGHPFGCSFWPLDATVSGGELQLSFSGNSGKCSEVRIEKFWQYGRFEAQMLPSNVPGSVSSLFLYTGTAGTGNHFEIDIEFLGSQPGVLHTNYWTAGVPHAVDIDVGAMGIDPFNAMRTYGIEWRAGWLAWYTVDAAGNHLELRREQVAVSAPMRFTLNTWFGDNLDTALVFPGPYAGTPGVARYGAVQVYR